MNFNLLSTCSLQYEIMMTHLQKHMEENLSLAADSPIKMIRCNDKFEDLIKSQSMWGYELLHVCHKPVTKCTEHENRPESNA